MSAAAAPAPSRQSPARPTVPWTRWESIAVLAAALLAHLYYFAWRDVPVLHDAAGYLRAAEDILRKGLFSKFELSEIRTYGWPLILSALARIARSLGIAARPVALEFQIAVHVAACAALRLAFRAAGASAGTTRALFLAVLLNPLALIYPGYLLTESLSFSVMILLFAVCILLASDAGARRFVTATAAGAFLAGAGVMIRPVGLCLVPVWIGAAAAAARLHRVGAFRIAKAAVVGCLFLASPFVPQLVNNATHYGVWTPLVVTHISADNAWLGIQYTKYATAHIPGTEPAVVYHNPMRGPDSPQLGAATSWYLRNPGHGLATVALHAFNLLDQDLPFPYNTSLNPAYYPAVTAANLLAVALGLAGVAFAGRYALRNPRWRTAYFLAVLALVCQIGSHSFYMVETRYGVPALMILYAFAIWLLTRLRSMGVRSRLATVVFTGVCAAGGTSLSMWVRSQAPLIRSARIPRRGPFVGVELSRWTLVDAGTGSEGQPILAAAEAGRFSAAFHSVTLQRNASYTVEFEARAPRGMTAELSVDLFGGDAYDQAEQNSLFENIARDWTRYSATWNSGSNAPSTASLRFVTLSRQPVEIRRVVFGPSP